MANPQTKRQPVTNDLSPDHPDVPMTHVEHGNELGGVQIHNNVIATIARLAVLKVQGVVEMSGGLVDGLAGMIGKKGSDRGIRVEMQEGSVIIEVFVVIEYGVQIPHVAWQIQTEVRQAVEQMTGMTVKAVQVSVEGVKILTGSSAKAELPEETQGV
jgi:uncharacterized alkaline shock family protein YloU